MEGENSREVTVDSGVPQGTVLGPILFLCHINDLPTSVKSQVRLFADDCLLYRPIKSIQDHLALQQDLEQLEKWAMNSGMRFNAKKCLVLSIRKKSTYYYSLDSHILEQVKSSPYLGVVLTEDLKWSTHINKTMKKASSTLGFLRRNLKFASAKCRRNAYISLVRSVMEYSSIVWDPHFQKDIDSLERIQRRGVRFITNDYRSRDAGCVHRMMESQGLPELSRRRKDNRLTFLYKIAEDKIPAIPPSLYLTEVRGKRNIRPTKRQDYIAANPIRRSCRNNTRCFTVPTSRSTVFEQSFVVRTIIDWNQLENNTVRFRERS